MSKYVLVPLRIATEVNLEEAVYWIAKRYYPIDKSEDFFGFRDRQIFHPEDEYPFRIGNPNTLPLQKFPLPSAEWDDWMKIENEMEALSEMQKYSAERGDWMARKIQCDLENQKTLDDQLVDAENELISLLRSGKIIATGELIGKLQGHRYASSQLKCINWFSSSELGEDLVW